MAKKKRRGIATPREMQNGEGMVRIRILPLHAIGGVGHAGDTAFMPLEEAEQYAADGYLEIIPLADDPVPSTAADQKAEGRRRKADQKAEGRRRKADQKAEGGKQKAGGILGLFSKEPDADASTALEANSEADAGEEAEGGTQEAEGSGQEAEGSTQAPAGDHAIMQPESKRGLQIVRLPRGK